MTEINETIVDGRVYEISFIFDNKLDEEAALAKSNALKQSIATLGGSFISEEAPYMRELAYEMIRVVNNVNVRFKRLSSTRKLFVILSLPPLQKILCTPSVHQ
jgi:hypothetical protein